MKEEDRMKGWILLAVGVDPMEPGQKPLDQYFTAGRNNGSVWE